MGRHQHGLHIGCATVSQHLSHGQAPGISYRPARATSPAMLRMRVPLGARCHGRQTNPRRARQSARPAQRFRHVVVHGGRPIATVHREGGAVGICPLAFHRFDQGGFFAARRRRRPGAIQCQTQVQTRRCRGPANRFVGAVPEPPADGGDELVLAAQVQKALLCPTVSPARVMPSITSWAHCISSMRSFECTRLAFIGICR